MRVLFFNPEQYVDFENEPSNIQLRLPILNCGLPIEHRDHVFQRDLRTAGRAAADRRALAAVADFRPDVVVYSATWEHENLSPGVLRTIRDGGAPVIGMLWDSWIEPTAAEAELLAGCSLLVVGDSLRAYLRCRLIGETLVPPTKTAFFAGQVFTDLVRPLPDEPALYDVTLLGSNEGERARLVAYLAEELPKRGVSFNKAGGLVDTSKPAAADGGRRADDWVDWDEYVRIVNRSRLCLNSATDPTRLQIKGKIFDYMACGVACLTDGNAEVRRFIPDGAAAFYDGPEDCLTQILQLLGDDGARRRIARAGQDWLARNFDYKRFWRGVLAAAVGDAPPPTLPVLEESFAALNRLRGLTLRAALAAAAPLAALALDAGTSGAETPRRLGAQWLGRRGAFHRLALEGGDCLAVNRMPVDVVQSAAGRLLIADAFGGAVPLPDPAQAAGGPWIFGRRGACAAVAADPGQLDALIDQGQPVADPAGIVGRS